MTTTLHNGDCLKIMAGMPDNSVNAIVTDPPYGLGEIKDIAGLLSAWLNDSDDNAYVGKNGFMGKEWDKCVPPPKVFREVLRVLKPCGYAFVFAGSRTQDLMAMSLRLAGFEIVDTIFWVYGSGFPKGANIGKLIDKAAGAEREVVEGIVDERYKYGLKSKLSMISSKPEDFQKCGVVTLPATELATQFEGYKTQLKPAYEPIIIAMKPPAKITCEQIRQATGWDYWHDEKEKANTPEYRAKQKRKYGVDLPVDADKFEVVSRKALHGDVQTSKAILAVYKTDEGENRQVVHEHVTPFKKWTAKTFVANAIVNGVAGFNIDDCRIEVDEDEPNLVLNAKNHIHSKDDSLIGFAKYFGVGVKTQDNGYHNSKGRYPANLIHDGSEGVLKVFRKAGKVKPAPWKEGLYADRYFYCAKASPRERSIGLDDLPEKVKVFNGKSGQSSNDLKPVEKRFTTKARNIHPTVKPVAVMRYLVEMVKSPQNPVILDPFMGSGTTGIACKLEGVDFIGIERDTEHGYFDIAKRRIENAHLYTEEAMAKPRKAKRKVSPLQVSLFENLKDDTP